MDSSGKSLSFGFSKIKENKKLVRSVIKEDDHETRVETDFIKSLEDKVVKSEKPVEAWKPLVIPLIQANKWKVPTPEDLEKSDNVEENTKTKARNPVICQTGDNITDTAVQELVQEARREQDEWEGRGTDTTTRSIPLLLQNKIPAGYETDDKLDVSLRPDVGDDADYAAVPIEQYGMAMLRGMGFSENKGIGTDNKPVKPIEAIARPKGMGLGADRSLLLQQQADQKAQEKGSKDEDLVLKKGAYCMVQSGKHQGLYAVVEGIDEDNCRVVIKLTLGGSTVTLNQLAVKLVTRKEYDKYSKYLNKTKVDKYKEEEDKKKGSKVMRDDGGSGSGSEVKGHKHKKHRHRDNDDEHYRDSKKHKSRRKDGEYTDSDGKYSDREQRKHRHHEKDDSKRHKDRSQSPVERKEKTHKKKDRSGESSKSSNGVSRHSCWLHPHLRVRIIDPEYCRGKHYKNKVIIEDVVSLDTCICRTDDHKLLDDLHQNQLETVIPKSHGSCVMVVSGQHKSKVGEIVDRDKSSCTAIIQLLPDKDEILTLAYDRICEYTGNIHDLR